MNDESDKMTKEKPLSEKVARSEFIGLAEGINEIYWLGRKDVAEAVERFTSAITKPQCNCDWCVEELRKEIFGDLK